MTLAHIADRNARGDGLEAADGLAAFVALDKAFQRATKRAGFVAAPYTPTGSVTSRWAVAASTQADIVKIVRLTKSPVVWEEKPGGGWYVFLVYGADTTAIARAVVS
jgi:hypothetical protein